MAYKGIAAGVLAAATDHIGIHFSAASLKELSDLEYSQTQIGQALSTLAQNGIVQRVGRGIYVYKGATPEQSEDQHLFETVGKLKDGSILVQSDDGEFYVLTTLEQHYGKDKE